MANDETQHAPGLFIGASEQGAAILNLKRANRHGLIAGATGTGKTVTLQGIAEGFSEAGVPVFLADVKGDLAGLAMAGSANDKTHEIFAARAKEIGQDDWTCHDNPVMFWDLFGEQGHPLRMTVSEMGPLLLARMLGLNDTQEGVLAIAFKVADDEQMLLLDLDDLQAMLIWCADNAADISTRYGNVTKASVGAIQRQLLTLESQGAAKFFGEPALDIHDMIRTDDQGRGYINILAADRLMQSPGLYGVFLLWLLSDLFQTLPEIGDPDKPVLCFFFDEAHLLFDDAPDALLDKIEQVVRLVRSKGVGVYFITQNPVDIPEAIAGQLGNRVQHALRAFTPKDQKAVKAAADTFRANPGVDVATAITELKIGEALVSMLQPDGAPEPVQRVLVKAPASRVGPISAKERAILQSISPVADKYDTPIDRESAEELIAAKTVQAKAAAEEAKAQAEADKQAAAEAKVQARIAAQEQARRAREAAKPGVTEKIMKSAASSAATSIGRRLGSSLAGNIGANLGGQLLRGVLGSLFK